MHVRILSRLHVRRSRRQAAERGLPPSVELERGSHVVPVPAPAPSSEPALSVTPTLNSKRAAMGVEHVEHAPGAHGAPNAIPAPNVKRPALSFRRPVLHVKRPDLDAKRPAPNAVRPTAGRPAVARRSLNVGRLALAGGGPTLDRPALAVDRPPVPWELTVFSLVTFAVILTNSGPWGSKPRFLIPSLALCVPPAIWLGKFDHRPRMQWAIVLGVAIVSALCSAYIDGPSPSAL
jgi:hypothetical protein